MQAPSVQSSRENNFNILRFVASLMVIAGHMGFIAGSPVPAFLGQGVQVIGVKIFFISGGYLIAKSWMSDSNPLRYAAKRAARILPALAVYVLFAAIIAGPLISTLPAGEYFKSPAFRNYLKNIALYINYVLPGVFENNPYPNAVNGSLWTLPVEAAMYVAVPVLLSLIMVKKKSIYTRIAMGIIVLATCFFQLLHLAYFPEWRHVIYATDIPSAMTLVPYYLIGVAYAFPDMKRLLNLPLASILILIAACFNLSNVKNELALYLVLPYFVFSFAFSQQIRLSKWLEKYEISYGMYLYGFFVQQTIVYLCNRAGISLSPSIYFVLSSLITAVFALISYKFVEQPVLKWSKRLIRG